MWGFDALSSHLITHGQIQNFNFNLKKISCLQLQLDTHINAKYGALFWAPYLQREATLYQREWKVQIGVSFSNHLHTPIRRCREPAGWWEIAQQQQGSLLQSNKCRCHNNNARLLKTSQKNPTTLFKRKESFFILSGESVKQQKQRWHILSSFQRSKGAVLWGIPKTKGYYTVQPFSSSQLTPKSWVYSV